MNSAESLSLAQDVEPKSIAVRAYVPSSNKREFAAQNKSRNRNRDASEWSLTFDTETTIDPGQNLRFGCYQFRKARDLMEEGLFYDPEIMSAKETALLKRYAEEHGLECMTTIRFSEDIVFGTAYKFRASIIGFNLPFDISRLAIRHHSARGKVMKGGFSFILSDKRYLPRIQIKHLSSSAALIQFTTPPRISETRSEKKRLGKRPPRRGAFIDLKTLSKSLLSHSFSLASLSQFLDVIHKKEASDKHGETLSSQYIDYSRNDVQSTWECYVRLLDKFQEHGLTKSNPNRVKSEAGIGKAYLGEMGIKPFFSMRPDFPEWLMGAALSSYYGGRSEIHWRRERVQVLYCDFLSMYPTVFTLMGLWKFVIADGVTWRDTTIETNQWLHDLRLEDLQKPETWANLTTLVRVQPCADLFPVRSNYGGQSLTIGLNYLSGDQPLWFTLADAIASFMLTGKPPVILEAITFSPSSPQEGLKAISICGDREFRIDPSQTDFFKRVIDLRSKVKARMKKAQGRERERLESQQLGLKLLANSTSHGIFVEVNVNDLDDYEQRQCFGPLEPFAVETNKDEEPGKYFHPFSLR